MQLELPIHDPRVRDAFAAVRREDFLPPAQRAHAGEDRPLPIGFGQTASQPSLIAFMVDQLSLAPTSRVLEVGCGTGFQTAVLASLCAEVFAVDVVPELVELARASLTAFRNVQLCVGDGRHGWPDAAPFDGIVVCAAAESIPADLVTQLAPGGRLVIPIGKPDDAELLRVEKRVDGAVKTVPLIGVRFVPLVHRAPGR